MIYDNTMSLKQWKKLSESVLFKNPWWTYKRDDTVLPNGKRGVYHYVHTNGSSMVIPILPDGKFVLVKQFRYLNNRESIEFPCGGVKELHTYEDTAKQELLEEAGYQASEWRLLGQFNPYNGVTNELCRVYLAKQLESFPSTPDETEEFEKIFLTSKEIEEKIHDGLIWDGMTIAAWTIAKSSFQH
jgi:ADP-ribose pyrophosphatase